VAEVPERGARIARREEGEYREYSTDEQRREAGRPTREFGQLSRFQVDQRARSPQPSMTGDFDFIVRFTLAMSAAVVVTVAVTAAIFLVVRRRSRNLRPPPANNPSRTSGR
jgi:hypothetical protein